MRKKEFVNIYNQNIDSPTNYEKNMFDYFKKLYDEKLKDKDFSYNIEKCKLITRINNDNSNIISMYVSVVVSIVTFLLGILLGNNYSGTQLTILSFGFVLIIIGLCGFVIVRMFKNMNKNDIWNIALIALEASKKGSEDHKDKIKE